MFILLSGTSIASFGLAVCAIFPSFAAAIGVTATPIVSSVSSLALFGRLFIGSVLAVLAVDVRKRAVKVDVTKPQMIFDYYMYIWSIFYGCYLLLPFAK